MVLSVFSKHEVSNFELTLGDAAYGRPAERNLGHSKMRLKSVLRVITVIESFLTVPLILLSAASRLPWPFISG